MAKENNSNESETFIVVIVSENEIPDLNSLKSFEFEPKQTSEIVTVAAVMMRKKVLNIK